MKLKSYLEKVNVCQGCCRGNSANIHIYGDLMTNVELTHVRIDLQKHADKERVLKEAIMRVHERRPELDTIIAEETRTEKNVELKKIYIAKLGGNNIAYHDFFFNIDLKDKETIDAIVECKHHGLPSQPQQIPHLWDQKSGVLYVNWIEFDAVNGLQRLNDLSVYDK
jgi:hypothetical protein